MQKLLSLAFALEATALTIQQPRHFRRQDDHPVRFEAPGDASLHIPNEYMIHLHSGYTFKQHFDTIKTDMSTACEEYFQLDAINAYHCRIADESIIHEKVREDTNVDIVQQNTIVEQDVPVEEGETKGQGDREGKDHVEPDLSDTGRDFHEWKWVDTTWNLAMITAKGQETLDPAAPYDYPVFDKPGLGVNIYILDTGVKTSHKSFDSSDGFKIRNFKGAKDTDKSPYRSGTFEDETGHGTHVASIAAGRDALFSGGQWFGLGVANWATIVNVPVTEGNPGRSNSDILAKAIIDVTAEHNEFKRKQPQGWQGSVINMSLGAENTKALKDACASAASAGVAIVTSAGNTAQDTGNLNKAPCRYSSVLCVGSANPDYQRSLFSNYGRFVDIFAPGLRIWGADSTKTDDPWAMVQKSGTSMAAPHAAGIMAVYIAWEGKKLRKKHAEVVKRIAANKMKGVVDVHGAPQTTRDLLNSGIQSHPSDAPYKGIPDEKDGLSVPECSVWLRETKLCKADGQGEELYFHFSAWGPDGETLYQTAAQDRLAGIPMNGKSFDLPGDHGGLTFNKDGVNPIIKAGDVTINAAESCLAEDAFWDEANPSCPDRAAFREFECTIRCDKPISGEPTDPTGPITKIL